MVDLIIAGGQIYTEEKILTDAAIYIEKNKIIAIEKRQTAKMIAKQVIELGEQCAVLPGFIDLHIHGANGKDVMDSSIEALNTISESLTQEGVTSFLATTMTASTAEIEKAVVNANTFLQQAKKNKGAQLLGVHLEGPFISLNRVGAQREDQVISPNVDLIKRWQTAADNIIKLVTLAPELKNSLAFIRFLREQHIVPSIGHTDATYEQTVKAIEAGCLHVTHLFNAMRGIHQREPGPAVAALLSPQVTAELIADGIHLHPAMIELAIKLKGLEKIILVSDAMRAKCLCDGVYDLGGQTVHVKDKAARLADGTLAGSTLTIIQAVKYLLQNVNCSLRDLVKFTSVNPAKLLNLFDRKGSLAANKEADIVVLNHQHEVILTVVQGKIVFQY